MKRIVVLIVIIIAFIALIVGANFLYDHLRGLTDKENTTHNEEKTLAPDFTVLDIKGKEVSLSDHKGKPVVLNFWASWCGPCKNEMPDFEEKFKEYGEDIVFMMVNLTDGNSETIESATNLINSQGYTFPVYFDTKNEAGIAYGTSSIPVTYFIDKDGYIVAYGRGMLSSEGIMQGINMIK